MVAVNEEGNGDHCGAKEMRVLKERKLKNFISIIHVESEKCMLEGKVWLATPEMLGKISMLDLSLESSEHKIVDLEAQPTVALAQSNLCWLKVSVMCRDKEFSVRQQSIYFANNLTNFLRFKPALKAPPKFISKQLFYLAYAPCHQLEIYTWHSIMPSVMIDLTFEKLC